MSSTAYDPEVVWQTAYGELQLQIAPATFNMWLRSARLLAHEDGTFVIGVANNYAREWLDQRLKVVILKTLKRIARRSVEVRFVVWQPPTSQELHEAGPLLASLAPEPEAKPVFERLHPGETGINERFHFENYAVGAGNRLAHAAAEAVVENPGRQFNPLYIHSDVGMGKSHLLHAIGNRSLNRGLRPIAVSAETFTNDLIASIKSRTMAAFREKYREVDLLLVDDIQFMAGKESTQEEFYHTFNDLFNRGAQIVVTADAAPDQIKLLDPRLRSRFEGGLVVPLDPPDFATRIEILEIKSTTRGFNDRLSPDVLAVIAGESPGSMRDLEGALNRVMAASLLTDNLPDLGVAEEILSQMSQERTRHTALDIDDVIMAVADYYGIRPDDLLGRGRSRVISTARQVVMYLAREEADISLQQIGDVLGGRNHSTVLYSCERIAELMQTDSQMRRQIRAILAILRPHDQHHHPDSHSLQ